MKNVQQEVLADVERLVAEQEQQMRRRPEPLATARVHRVVRAYVEAIVERALRGERVFVPGLGVFKAVTRKPRRTLHEGRWYEVPAKRVVVMRPSAAANRKRGAP